MTDQTTLPAVRLNARREIFCTKYANGETATQAAILAGYSKKTARQIGSQLLKKPEIKACVAKIQSQTSTDARLTVQDHINDLKDVADDAKVANQHGARATAVKAQGQVAGLYAPGGIDEDALVPTDDIVHMLAYGREWAEVALGKLFGGDFEGFEGTLRQHFSDVFGVKLIEMDADDG